MENCYTPTMLMAMMMMMMTTMSIMMMGGGGGGTLCFISTNFVHHLFGF